MEPARVSMLFLLHLFASLIHTGDALQSVSLTVSSLRTPLEGEGQHVVERELEMNWQPGLDADWIGLFDSTPPQAANEEMEPLVRINPADYPDGYHRTNISFPRQPYPNGWNKGSEEKPVPGDVCISYWIAAYKNNELLQADCRKMRPTWMGDHREKLQSMTLAEIFFPGTHNSGSYNVRNTPSPDETVGRYVLTQDTDVWGQLVHGIRYLDLQIGYYSAHRKTSSSSDTKEDDSYWVNHELVNIRALRPVLEDIKEFLKKTRYEIIIIDFHNFPVGFKGHPSHHQRFVSLLHSVLGDFVIPFGNITYNSTLEDVWNTGRNLIVTYNDVETTKESTWLWGPVPQMWGDKQTPEGLKAFLQQCMDDASTSNRTTFWAAMAVLRPTPIDFMFGGYASLRELADVVNRNVTKWFQDDWWRQANIVVTDFFLGNNIIDVSINACLKRANNTVFQVVSAEE